jgi:CDP-diacylglycerol--glycerol-3-phosphate 3-phosphatidyltransferase
MKLFLKKVPLYLIYSRLIIGIIILSLSLLQSTWYRWCMVILMILGVFTDIFDGIIARRLEVSTERMRRLDSLIDQIFWLMILGATCITCPQFLLQHYVEITIILAAEAVAYLISYIRFRKEVATHAISSKIWTLTILATIIQIMLSCKVGVLFQCCFYLGLATRLEIILIVSIIRNWYNDVPSVYHAILLRKGRDIKRSKLFNG